MAARGVDKSQTRARKPKHTPTEIEAGLRVLAYAGGNSARASKITGIPAQTLRHWRLYDHRDLYEEIREREGPALEALAASDARDSILRAGQIEHRVFDKLDTEFDDLDPKAIQELTGALQRMATAKGINGTKLLELTGRPTQVTEHREGADVLKELRQRVPWMFVDSTATELPPIALQAHVSTETREASPPSHPAD